MTLLPQLTKYAVFMMFLFIVFVIFREVVPVRPEYKIDKACFEISFMSVKMGKEGNIVEESFFPSHVSRRWPN